jgi:hypothetical protein
MSSGRVAWNGCAELTSGEVLAGGKALFSVKAQAVRQVRICEQDIYSQTTHREEMSEVPGGLAQRQSPNAVSWALRLDERG